MRSNRSRNVLVALVIGLAASFALLPQASLAVVPKITSFTPTSGPIGTQVVVKGTALSGARTVTFDGTSAVFTGNTATQVKATAPATGTGPLTITTSGGTATSATSFTITPSAQLVPTSGHPSVPVTVTGAGFGPYTSVDVYFDTTDVALGVSNGLGVVSITILVPTAGQPGTHWITLDARANHYAAQQTFTVNTNWLMPGFAAANAGSNPFENTLNTSNVATLTTAWTQPSGTFGNESPFIEANGSVFMADVEGAIHAFSNTGKLLWTATEVESLPVPEPASNGTFVFFGSGSSVYGFKTACRKDGGVCTPTWVTDIGTTVSAGLTFFQNELYVPGADGSIHPLNPTTGVAGAPFYAISNTLGAITTPVAFAADGTYYYGTGSHVNFATPGIGAGQAPQNGTVSPIAISAGRAFYTTSDGVAHRFFGWSQPTSGTGCVVAPAIANNLVYAGGCNSIAAFQSGSGALWWSVTTSGAILGISVANGVLYTCQNASEGAAELTAYDALYGSVLWSGGGCTQEPVVANGTVFAALASISAYNLADLNPNYVAARPQLSELKPDYALTMQRTP